MTGKYLLDTNAYFNFMKYTSLSPNTGEGTTYASAIASIQSGECYISALSQIEIISVIGKYARGSGKGKSKCTCVVSEDGEICQNYRYSREIKPMKKNLVRQWMKLIDDTVSGSSPVLHVSVLPVTSAMLQEAQSMIRYALMHRFGSLDALIAATVKVQREEAGMKDLKLITSDGGLKACLDKCGIPYWDAFSS